MSKTKSETEEPKEKTTRPLDPIVVAKRKLKALRFKRQGQQKYIDASVETDREIKDCITELSTLLKSEQDSLRE